MAKDRSIAERMEAFARRYVARRSVRQFQTGEMDSAIVREAVRAASASPSGANAQPWYFLCISDPAVKAVLRQLAEEEERDVEIASSAPSRIRQNLGLRHDKSFFEDASWVIALFALAPRRPERKAFLVEESVGIACGTLVCAFQSAGVSTLVHSPVADDYVKELAGVTEDDTLFAYVCAGTALKRGANAPLLHERKPFHAVAGFV